MQRLRRSFITGFFVTVPLVVSVVAIVWTFRWADSVTRRLTQHIPGLDIPGLGIVATGLIILGIGAVATNVIGRRVLQRGEWLLLHVPLFRTIYAPVKQLLNAFSPDSSVGFKRMVLVEDAAKGFALGFLMKDFVVDRGRGAEPMLAVYVPTNHLYLGDVIVCRPETVTYPDISVEEGLRIFLTGGMGIPDTLRTERHQEN